MHSTEVDSFRREGYTKLIKVGQVCFHQVTGTWKGVQVLNNVGPTMQSLTATSTMS